MKKVIGYSLIIIPILIVFIGYKMLLHITWKHYFFAWGLAILVLIAIGILLWICYCGAKMIQSEEDDS